MLLHFITLFVCFSHAIVGNVSVIRTRKPSCRKETALCRTLPTPPYLTWNFAMIPLEQIGTSLSLRSED